MVSLESIIRAADSIRTVAHRTPLDYSTTLSQLTNHSVYLKLENLQKTGSFKLRGAFYKIETLSANERARGVIAASAGNHAQGVAYAASRAGIPSTIVMPEGAPLAKVEATTQYGARVVLHGPTYDDAFLWAQQLQKETGAVFIHAFDDADVIAGQGTIGLEILEQLPDVEAVVVPVGGGGLIAGVAMAIKSLRPDVRLIGVQASGSASMAQSMAERRPVELPEVSTIADGIAVKRPGQLTYALVDKYVDDIVTVDDVEIARTMVHLLERNKLSVEGAGAVGLAALLYKRIENLTQNKVAVLLSGGNVDVNFLSKVIQHGLAETGRYIRIATSVPDKPGYLHQLLRIIADARANVISIQHDRVGSKILLGQAEVELDIETRDQAHIDRILEQLQQAGYPVVTK